MISSDGTSEILCTDRRGDAWSIKWHPASRITIAPPPVLEGNNVAVDEHVAMMIQVFAHAAQLDWMRCYLHNHPAALAGFVPLPLLAKDIPMEGFLWKPLMEPWRGDPWNALKTQYKGGLSHTQEDLEEYLNRALPGVSDTSGWFAPHHGEEFRRTGNLPPFGTPYLAFSSAGKGTAKRFVWEARQLGFGHGLAAMPPVTWDDTEAVRVLVDFASSYTQEDAITLGMLGSASQTYTDEMKKWDKHNAVIALRKKFTPKNQVKVRLIEDAVGEAIASLSRRGPFCGTKRYLWLNEEEYRIRSYKEPLAELPGYSVENPEGESPTRAGNKNAAVCLEWSEFDGRYFARSHEHRPFTEEMYREDVAAITRVVEGKGLGTVIASGFIPFPEGQTPARGYADGHVYGFCLIAKNPSLVMENKEVFSPKCEETVNAIHAGAKGT